MNASERYIQEVLRRVLASETDRQRLAEDLRTHFIDGQTRGDTTAQIIARLGTPNDVAEAFHLERSLVFAGFFRRLVAFIGDMGALAILVLPLVASGIWFIRQVEPEGWGRAFTLTAVASTALASLGLFVCYFPLLEARFGKTIGKHLLAIRVVRETGTPISLGQAFLRRLSFYFEMLLADSLFIPFTPAKQRALDMLARTVVVREPGRDTGPWGWICCILLALVALGSVATVMYLCGS
jgi:uncharacterized RDD family membrane protein YckC